LDVHGLALESDGPTIDELVGGITRYWKAIYDPVLWLVWGRLALKTKPELRARRPRKVW